MPEKPLVTDFVTALTQLGKERGLSSDEIVDAIESALMHAYRREYSPQQDVTVRIDQTTGVPHLYELRTVTRFNVGRPDTLPVAAARLRNPDAKEGERIELAIDMPPSFGRVAAQTVKQVVLQKMREAEREHVFEEFSNQELELVTGVVQRIEGKSVYVGLGKSEAILPPTEQIPDEVYRTGQHVRSLLLEVHRTTKGPQLFLSRTHRTFLKRLFEVEVPEVHDGTVDIKGIAREPGSRSKVAVTARREGLDPIGACVGLHRTRIQNIVQELHGEKVDIILWDPDPAAFVASALSPARVVHVKIDDGGRRASVTVPVDQMSLAIGKEGQNARLAAKLTGWKIDIRPAEGVEMEINVEAALVSDQVPRGDA